MQALCPPCPLYRLIRTLGITPLSQLLHIPQTGEISKPSRGFEKF
jgi:hypothetical protein